MEIDIVNNLVNYFDTWFVEKKDHCAQIVISELTRQGLIPPRGLTPKNYCETVNKWLCFFPSLQLTIYSRNFCFVELHQVQQIIYDHNFNLMSSQNNCECTTLSYEIILLGYANKDTSCSYVNKKSQANSLFRLSIKSAQNSLQNQR